MFILFIASFRIFSFSTWANTTSPTLKLGLVFLVAPSKSIEFKVASLFVDIFTLKIQLKMVLILVLPDFY